MDTVQLWTNMWASAGLSPTDLASEVLGAYPPGSDKPARSTIVGWIKSGSVPGREKNSATWDRDSRKAVAALAAISTVAERLMGSRSTDWFTDFVFACDERVSARSSFNPSERPSSRTNKLVAHVVPLGASGLPTLGDLDIAADRWQQRSPDTQNAVPPYVPRAEDEALSRLVSTACESDGTPWSRVVVVRGEPVSGKTRSLLHHLLASLPPDTIVLIPRTIGDIAAISRELSKGVLKRMQLVLLDDLQDAIASERADLGRSLHRLAGCRGAIVAATVHSSALPLEPVDAVDVRRLEAVGLDDETRSHLLDRSVVLRTDLTDKELANAAEFRVAIGGQGIERFTQLAATLRSIPQLRRYWQREHGGGSHEARTRAAVLDGMMDAWLFHVEPVATETLTELAQEHRPPNTPTLTEREIGDARAWANHPDLAGLFSFNASADSQTYRLHDSIAYWVLPDYEPAEEFRSPTELMVAGFAARRAGDDARAERWWTLAADAGQVNAAHEVGYLMWKKGRIDDVPFHAAYWLKIAAAAGDDRSMDALGRIRQAQGRVDDDVPDHAPYWFKLAINSGNTWAMNNLGVLRWQQDRVTDDNSDHAPRWLKQAAEAGLSSAMRNMGVLRRRQKRADDGEFDHAPYWFTLAANAGNSTAMVDLARHRLGQGRVDEDVFDHAPYWLKLGAAAGNYWAMHDLGNLRRRQGRIEDDVFDDAPYWLKLAASRGNASAMNDLGHLRRKQGRLDDNDPDHAPHWFRLAAEAGFVVAMSSLGRLRESQGRVEDDVPDHAPYWYKRAIAAGSIIAMTYLGRLREIQERTDDDVFDHASYWYTLAANAGNAMGMSYLGRLREGQSRVEDDVPDHAPYWYKLAIAAGSIGAMESLGRLRESQGRIDQDVFDHAPYWFAMATVSSKNRKTGPHSLQQRHSDRSSTS